MDYLFDLHASNSACVTCMRADRKTAGRSEGKVTVNGFEKKPSSFARVMGYCEQFDIHSRGLTVGESVHLSALLRLAADVTAADVRFSLPHMHIHEHGSFHSLTCLQRTCVKVP